MVKIYYSSFESQLDDSVFHKYVEPFDLDMKAKILRFRRWQDAHAYLFGRLLLKKGLKDLGLKSSLINLRYSKFGRPFLEGNVDFNISHSGSYVVCAFSTTSKIGIDLEEVRTIQIHDFKNLFSEEEWKDIIHSENIFSRFYYYWTAKEAVIKAVGEGLSIPLREVLIIEDKVKLNQNLWHLRKVKFFEDYILQIATDKKIQEEMDLIPLSF
jgi:4'-phosphopantetheinyl transferase